MFIELKCKQCNNLFQIQFDKKEIGVEKCPCCKAALLRTDIEKIYSITEKCRHFIPSLSSIEFVSIQDGEYDLLYSEDLQNIDRVYRSSSNTVRELIASMLDKIFLLCYHDAADENTASLSGKAKAVHESFMKILDEKSKNSTLNIDE